MASIASQVEITVRGFEKMTLLFPSVMDEVLTAENYVANTCHALPVAVSQLTW